MTVVAMTEFTRVTDVTIARASVISWPQFAERLSTFKVANDKKQVAGYAAAVFEPICTCRAADCPGQQGHRIDPTVVRVFALILDLDKHADKTPLTSAAADAALARLRELGLQHVVHTTHSHAPPRLVALRVAIALSRPVLGAEWSRFWPAAVAHLAIHVEPSCSNPSRFWFLPSHPPGIEPWARNVGGSALDVDAILATVTPSSEHENGPKKKPKTNGATYSPRPGQFSIDDFVRDHCSDAKEYSKGSRRCWDIECPWESEHSSSSNRDTVVSFDPSEGPAFSCLHDHCRERSWTEFRKHHEPGWVPYEDRQHERQYTNGQRSSNRTPPTDWEREAVADWEPADPHVTSNGSWPDPEPLRRKIKPPAPYPVHALGATLAGAALRLHETVQAPLALCGQSLLAAASLAAQPHANVIVDGRTNLLTLWAITIAESGERKSAIDTIALSAHVSHERDQIEANEAANRDYGTRQAAYEEVVLRAKRTKGSSADVVAAAIASCGPAPIPPPSGFLMVREPTIEAVQKIFLSGAPSLGLFTDEGATFFGGHSMSKEHVMRSAGALSKLWDDGSSDRIRAGDGASKIYGRRLAMHLLMQPVIAARVLSDDMLSGQGFLARALITWPDTTAGTRAYRSDNPTATAELRSYHARMGLLLTATPRFRAGRHGQLEPRELALSTDAKRVWVEAYDAIEKQIATGNPYAEVRPWASKGAEQILRIAGVLTLLDNHHAPQIEASTIVAAAELVAFYLSEAVRLAAVADDAKETRNAQAILDWCKTKNTFVIDSRSLLHHGPRSVRSNDAVTEAMAVLVRTGWAIPVKDATIDGRKPRRAWRVRTDV